MLTMTFNKTNIKSSIEKIIGSIKSPFVLLRTFCWAFFFKKMKNVWFKHSLMTNKEVECAAISRTVFSCILILFLPFGLVLWHSGHPWLSEPGLLIFTLCSIGLTGIIGLYLNYKKKGLGSQWGYSPLQSKDLDDLIDWMSEDKAVEKTVNEWVKSNSTTIRYHDFLVLKIAFFKSWLKFKKK